MNPTSEQLESLFKTNLERELFYRLEKLDHELIMKNIEMEELRRKIDKNLRTAWEEGFRLCSSYGDNKHHFCGEQKEKQWQKFKESLENNS